MLGLLWCGFALLLHVAFFGAFTCHADGSNCAFSHVKDGVYRGVLADDQGRPLTAATFTVGFESRSGLRDVGGFSTDAAGRYCIVWPSERIAPYARVAGATYPIEAEWAPLNGAAPPRGCRPGDAGIPWNRADDFLDRWQYGSAFAALVAAMAVLGFALGFSATGRLDKAGIGLAAAATAYAAAIWLL